MASIQLPTSSAPPNPRKRPLTRVMVRKQWTDNWVESPYLQPLAADDAAGPTMPKATFKWLAGEIKYEDQLGYQLVSPISLRTYFVRIDLLYPGYEPAALWYGRFSDESFVAAGTDIAELGDETLTAYGLAQELDRQAINGSYVTNDQSTGFQITASVPFNLDFVRGVSELGNRSSSKVTVPADANVAHGGITSAYALSGHQTADDDGQIPKRTSTPWSVGDIVEYLLGFFGSSQVPFTLGGQVDALAKIILPKVRVDGRTVFALLNSLIDRRRGLGWRLNVTDRLAEVQIFTSLEQAVKIEDGLVPANANQQSINAASYGHIIDRAQTTFDARSAYGRIIVNGEPVVACFTVSYQDGNLIPGWTDAEENDYQDGSSVGGATPKQNDEARERDEVAHVYTHHLIDETNWAWKVGDGIGGNKTNANLLIEIDGTLDTTPVADPAPVRNWGHTLLRSLPILKTMSRTGSRPEYREPICLIYDLDSKQYVHLHKLAGEGVSGHLRMLDRDFGFQTIMHPAHLLALGSFDSQSSSASASPTEKQPKYDYRNMIATVAARTDAKLSVIVDVPQADVSRCLVIDVPDAETWYVVKGTVLDVDDSGALVTLSDLATVRDDSPRLRQIAALAKAWYGVPRSALHLSVKDIWQQFPVGTMIRTLDDPFAAVPVNTAVSRVAWDLLTMSSTIDTSYAELDVKWTAGPSRHTLS